MKRLNLFLEIGRAVGAGAHSTARALLRILTDARDDERADDATEHRRRSMRKSADARRCPRCGRSGALGEKEIPGDGTVRRCRWCGYEREPKP